MVFVEVLRCFGVAIWGVRRIIWGMFMWCVGVVGDYFCVVDF